MSTDPGTSPRAGLGARARATTTTRSSAPPEPRSPGQEALVILLSGLHFIPRVYEYFISQSLLTLVRPEDTLRQR